MLKQFLIVPALSLALAGAAWAQGQPGQPPAGAFAAQSTAERMFIPMQDSEQLLARSLIGSTVVDAGGAQVGTVKDLLLDKDGRTAGYVVGFGGMLGIGDKAVAIPFQRGDVATAEKGDGMVLRLKFAKEELDSAPEFKDAEALESDQAKRKRSTGGATGGGGQPR